MVGEVMLSDEKHYDPTWPYEEVESHETIASEPTWTCAEGGCSCHTETAKRQPRETFSVLLCDNHARRMPWARCRVLAQGVVLNEEKPNADAKGWITIEHWRLPEQIIVEWAPRGMPLEPRYPYRKLYYVHIPADDRDEGARRRLHNLGFSVEATLEGNIRAFQSAYGHTPTGEIAHVEKTLIDFHDHGLLPPVKRHEEDRDGGRLAVRETAPRQASPGDSRPRSGALSALDTSEDFATVHDVRYVPMPKGKNMVCWAASSTMLVSWRDRRGRDPFDILQVLSNAKNNRDYYGRLFDNNEPLPSADLFVEFVEQLDLVAPIGRSISPRELNRILQEFGPIGVNTTEHQSQAITHVWIVFGISMDADRGGEVRVLFHDPDLRRGSDREVSFDEFNAHYERAARLNTWAFFRCREKNDH